MCRVNDHFFLVSRNNSDGHTEESGGDSQQGLRARRKNIRRNIKGGRRGDIGQTLQRPLSARHLADRLRHADQHEHQRGHQ